MTSTCSAQTSDSCLGRSGLNASALVSPQNIHDACLERLTVFDRCLDGIDGMQVALQGESILKIGRDQEPIAAIASSLRSNPRKELHLVAHGLPGIIKLGHSIDRAGLFNKVTDLREWCVDRIYLWSCNVGQDILFVSTLQSLTGARVFSSEHKLGCGQSLMGASFSALSDEIRRLKFTINS